MNDGDALLKAILANPDEDTPRLVYADWLEENGEEARAEFIRVQVELARLSPPDDGDIEFKRYACEQCWVVSDSDTFQCVPSRCPHCHHDRMRKLRKSDVHGDGRRELTRRDRELFYFHGFGWCEQIGCGRGNTGRLFPRPFLNWWSRGFLNSIECTAEDWLAYGDAIYWHPSQVVQCGHCIGRRPGDPKAYTMNHPCRVCWGKTWLPRPFLATAHPVRKVTLTTWKGWGIYRDLRNTGEFWRIDSRFWRIDSRAQALEYLSAQFPGIVFHFQIAEQIPTGAV